MTVNVKKARVRKGNKIKSPCFCRQGNIKNGRVHVHANQCDQMWRNFAALAIFWSVWQFTILSVYEQTLGPKLAVLKKILGKFSLLEKAKYWTNNIAIWTHWCQQKIILLKWLVLFSLSLCFGCTQLSKKGFRYVLKTSFCSSQEKRRIGTSAVAASPIINYLRWKEQLKPYRNTILGL